jgi:hypothetical protein
MKVLFIILIVTCILIIYFFNFNNYIKHAVLLSNKEIDYEQTKYSISNEIFKYNRTKILYEGFFISPINPIILYFIKNIHNDYKNIFIENLDNYVTFTRLKLSKSEIINCDWCSIVNGMLKLIILSIQKLIKFNDIQKLKNIDLKNTKRCLQWARCGILLRDKKITKKYIDNFINTTFLNYDDEIKELIYYISELYLIVEQIELRWCPFKSMEKYYRNTDERYLSINDETIYYAGKILSEYETIECHICNKVLNQKMDKKYISNIDIESPMKDFYLFLKE